MRLNTAQIHSIRSAVHALAPEGSSVWLFGSRVNDNARGGDIDLLLQVDGPVAEPARLCATVAARISRSLQGRKVDVLVQAPNLKTLPIHAIALAQGIRL
ncbi:MAG: nucleotidyltransferase domain-containing protein [Rhodoferax sp.]